MHIGVLISSDQTITADALGIGQHSTNRDNRQLIECRDAMVSEL